MSLTERRKRRRKGRGGGERRREAAVHSNEATKPKEEEMGGKKGGCFPHPLRWPISTGEGKKRKKGKGFKEKRTPRCPSFYLKKEEGERVQKEGESCGLSILELPQARPTGLERGKKREREPKRGGKGEKTWMLYLNEGRNSLKDLRKEKRGKD